MKKVFITGGSRGIGRACVRLFAQRGYEVAFQYNNNEVEAMSARKETGAAAYRCDFCEREQISALIEKVGECDVLVNCAGVSETGLLTDMDDGAYRRLMNVNLDAVFYLCRGFLPGMVRNHSGAIVNVSSVWGVCGASCEAAYSASKGGVIALTKALAKEYGPSGITCNCVCPGVIKTDMNAHLGEEDLSDLCERTPLMRLGTPEDVAKSVLFLSESPFVTGEILSCDGGFGL